MRRCPNCHAENSDDARFCVHCSFSLDWDTEQAGQVAKPEPVAVMAPSAPAADPAPPPPVVASPTVHVGLSAPALRVRAGATGGCNVRVRNTGAAAGYFRLELAGAATPFGSLAPSVLQLEPGEEATALLTLTPPHETPSSGGPLAFEVRASSDRDSTAAATARGTVEVLGARQPDRPAQDRRGLATVLFVVAGLLVVAALVTGEFAPVIFAVLVGAGGFVALKRR